MNNSNAPIASAPRENGSRRAVRRYVIFAVKIKYTRRGYTCTDSTSFASHLTWHLMPLHKSGLLVTLCPRGADAYLPRWQCKWKKTRSDTCTHHYTRIIYYMMTIARWFILKVAAFLHSSVKAIYFFHIFICVYTYMRIYRFITLINIAFMNSKKAWCITRTNIHWYNGMYLERIDRLLHITYRKTYTPYNSILDYLRWKEHIISLERDIILYPSIRMKDYKWVAHL